MKQEMEIENKELTVQPKKETGAMVFGTLDPAGVIEKATAIANNLVPIIEKAKLYSMITGKKYVRAEGWSTMLAMLGIFSSTEWSKRLERPNELAYESRVVLKHLSGLEVGAGEAICTSKERNWSNRDEYAIKSMSQTRALGKAARIGFSFIMSLAGYEPTPLEEMPDDLNGHNPLKPGMDKIDHIPGLVRASELPQPMDLENDAQEPEDVPPPRTEVYKRITEKQRKRLFAIWKAAGKSNDQVKDYLSARYGIKTTNDITMNIYEEIAEWCENGK